MSKTITTTTYRYGSEMVVCKMRLPRYRIRVCIASWYFVVKTVAKAEVVAWR